MTPEQAVRMPDILLTHVEYGKLVDALAKSRRKGIAAMNDRELFRERLAESERLRKEQEKEIERRALHLVILDVEEGVKP